MPQFKIDTFENYAQLLSYTHRNYDHTSKNACGSEIRNLNVIRLEQNDRKLNRIKPTQHIGLLSVGK